MSFPVFLFPPLSFTSSSLTVFLSCVVLGNSNSKLEKSFLSYAQCSSSSAVSFELLLVSLVHASTVLRFT